MARGLALHELMATRQVWQGHAASTPQLGIPTGFAALDAALPLGGWPRAALSELLLPAWGVGELGLLMPTLARLTAAQARVVLVAPPFIPYAIAWHRAGIDLARLDIIDTAAQDALWAFEQCLRSGSCAAVIGWPEQADHHAMRRLQVAADHGQALGFALRHQRHAGQASPVALRLRLQPGGQLQVLKCRGGPPPAQMLRLATMPAANADLARRPVNSNPVQTTAPEVMPCSGRA
ncbi:translesion DNA synthesis-associated protein ImuA [Corticibacter populi]|uniref:Translesion DNA synthesis-associated protein ImuA n=1 Tax=Corticibacter populi TaxID=1550736 RepID=A0A3M6QZG0_9BURK|nr:translesion DNA synthesis-associated protein ImuA [Corticibacter populi]RMX07922.1 translesion DNA synthesis-associated protein ImuA [Corticibacter populi]RZS35161.1 cell division inhibitor SulA [Corticibacter populi]